MEKTVQKSVSGLYKKGKVNSEAVAGEIKKTEKPVQARVLLSLSSEEAKLRNFRQAIAFAQNAYEIYKDLKMVEKRIDAVISLSRCYFQSDESTKGIEICLAELKNVQGITWAEAMMQNRIGVLFKEMRDFEKSLSYLKEANRKFEALQNFSTQVRISFIDNDKNLGVLLRNDHKYDSAQFYLKRGLSNARAIGNERWVAAILNSLGLLYQNIHNIPRAIECYEESIKLKAEADYAAGVSVTMVNLGKLYAQSNNRAKAEYYFTGAMEKAIQAKSNRAIMEASEAIADFYGEYGQPEKAYDFMKKAYSLRDTVYRSDIASESAKLEAVYENDKKTKEIELSNFKNEELKKNLELKSREQKMLIGGAVLLLMLLGWAGWSYMGKRKANRELEAKNEEVSNQKALLEYQNKDILDSINYAKKIQSAILPSEQDLKSLVKDAFILFSPRNIVSGDFYWISEKQNYVFYATADCTGHGVPGAFMSLLASSALNEIVNEGNTTEPAEVLNSLRLRIIQALRQRGEVGENKDGMDMVFCRLDKNKNELVVAASNNPVWIMNGNVETVKPDKFPVGISSGELKPFAQQAIQLKSGDIIYTFTDGFADQFGGPKGKKFMYRQMQDLLVSIHQLPCDEQHKTLLKRFNEWRGDLDQVDDVCVIGVRV